MNIDNALSLAHAAGWDGATLLEKRASKVQANDAISKGSSWRTTGLTFCNSGMKEMPSFPSWLDAIRADKTLANSGFSFLSDVEIDVDLTSETPFPGKYCIGESEENTSFESLKLWVPQGNPEQLFVSFCDDIESLLLPIEATPEALIQLAKDYIEPSKTIPKTVFSGPKFVDQLAGKKFARPVSLPSHKKKVLRYFIGMGDWDNDMVEIENGMTFNRFLDPSGICLATNENYSGNYSQTFTSFSASLFSVVRLQAGNTTCFYIEIEYLPCSHELFMSDLKSSVLEGHPASILPNDIPLDVLGAVLFMRREILWDKGRLLHNVNEDHFNSIIYLSIMLEEEEFEEVFIPLASHPRIEFRDFVAMDAFYRRNKKVLEAALENGVSDQVIQDTRG